MKPYQNREQSLPKKVTSFFKEFLKGLSRRRFKVLHFGFWQINEKKWGLAMYWEVEE